MREEMRRGANPTWSDRGRILPRMKEFRSTHLNFTRKKRSADRIPRMMFRWPSMTKKFRIIRRIPLLLSRVKDWEKITGLHYGKRNRTLLRSWSLRITHQHPLQH